MGLALKNEILLMLEKNRGEPISGSMIAERFGVSRNAVWKAVNSLNSEGHSITAVGKKGYILSPDSDVVTPESVRCFLGEELSDVSVFTFDKVGSTNDEAKKFCLSSPESRAVFIADCQTSGRGRFGRSFYSPSETGLYMSVVSHPNKSIENSSVYTAAAAVAAVRAIKAETGISPQIKWINDLYLGDKKVCGVLSEAVTDFETAQVRSMITGIGINITTESFPEELREKAASLGKRTNRSCLAAKIIGELYSLYELPPEQFMEEYRENCFLIGREVVFSDGGKEIEGRVSGVDDMCRLVIESGGESLVFSHGEIKRF